MCPSTDDFMSCAEDDTVRLWSINTPNARGVLNVLGAHLAAYDPSSSTFAVASASTHTVMLYDLRNFDKAPFSTFELHDVQKRYNPKGKNWTTLEFANDGQNILIGTSGPGHYVLDSYEGTLKHFCVRKGRSERRAPGEVGSARPAGQGDVCFSPEGQFVIGGAGRDEGLAVWDIKQPESSDSQLEHSVTLPFPPDHSDRVEIAMYNPRFNQMCTADKNFTMWLPDPELQT